MQNMELRKIATQAYVSKVFAENDELHHGESDPLSTRESKVEVLGKVLY